MIRTILHIALSFLMGGAIGLFFFVGLWITIRQMPGRRHPFLLAAISFVVRTLVVLALFYYLAVTARFEAILSALAGFIVMRIVILQLKTKDMKSKGSSPVKEETVKGGNE